VGAVPRRSFVADILIHNGTILTGYTRLENSCVLIENGEIADVFSEKRFRQKTFPPGTRIFNAGGAYITPGFIDTHIHGYGGYGTDDRDPESILAMSRRLADCGVTGFLPTIYTDDIEVMIDATQACVAAIGREEGARILGINLEGPFVSPKRLGAQKASAAKEVNLDIMTRLISAGKGHVVCMTVAPELKNMRDIALYAVKNGITLLAGHTDATYENMVEGMQAGILHSTHFFNAMSRLHHRDPGAVGAIMIHPEMACEIIADGHHVHPDLVKLLLRDKPVSKVVLVTDALKPTGQVEGPLSANKEEVYLKEELFYRKKDDVIAGSSLTMLRGVKNLVEWGIPIENAAQMASSNPARIYRFIGRGSLVPGSIADLTVFDRNFSLCSTIIGGVPVRNLLPEESSA
jgi:N-acetylglucosamine-6-phosphate deacetylase